MTCKCGHDMWEHYSDVSDTSDQGGDCSIIFENCSQCDCIRFEEKED